MQRSHFPIQKFHISSFIRKHALPTSSPVAVTQAQIQGAQVLCSSRMRKAEFTAIRHRRAPFLQTQATCRPRFCYPLLHKSSSEEHNKRSGTLKQDSRTHLLSLNSNLPFHTCGPFSNTHPNTLRTFGSLVITRAQRQDAQVLCNAKKRNARRIRTTELRFCAKKAIAQYMHAPFLP